MHYFSDFHPANDFTAVMDVVEAAEKTAVDNQAAQSACSPKGVPPPKCPCAQGLSYAPCKCAKDAPVRKIAWKPALISKIPQAPREKENKKKEGEDRAQQAAGWFLFVTYRCILLITISLYFNSCSKVTIYL